VDVLSVGIDNKNASIKSMLDSYIKLSIKNDMDCALLDCEQVGSNTFYKYNIDKEVLINIIGDVIWHYMINFILRQIIERECAYFDSGDREDIWVAAINKIKFQDMISSASMRDTITSKNTRVYGNQRRDIDRWVYKI